MTQRRRPSTRQRLVANHSVPPARSRKSKKSERTLMILAGAFIVVATVVAGYFMFADQGPEEITPSTSVAGASNPAQDAAAAQALMPQMQGLPLRVFPAGSDHAVGQERFAIGLVDEKGVPVQQGTVDMLFFTLENNQGTLTETLTAPFYPYGIEEQAPLGEAHDHGSTITGVFVAHPTFSKPGSWGVVARVKLPDGTFRAGQADFSVTVEDPVVRLGERAVSSRTLTASTPEEATKICTADPPDPMHSLSLDQALANGRPTVVLFATPLLCASRTCGPSLEAIAELNRRYGDKVNFIHVEIYPERDGTKPVAAMDEWSLPSEPWLFLIDVEGTIVERFEGGIGLTETDPALQKLIGTSVAT